MSEKIEFSILPGITKEDKTLSVRLPETPLSKEDRKEYEDWYSDLVRITSSEERRRAIDAWLEERGCKRDNKEVALSVHRLSLRRMWQALSETGLEPYKLIKWIAGQGYNPLMRLSKEAGKSPERFYDEIVDANIEMGYIEYPNQGEPSLDRSHIVQEGENVVDLEDKIHAHSTCNEYFLITEGKIALMVEIENAVRISESGTPTQRYSMKGKTVTLDLDNWQEDMEEKLVEIQGTTIFRDQNGKVVALGYTTQPNSHHILTEISSGTKLLLLKTPTADWNGEGKWTDRILHSCERV